MRRTPQPPGRARQRNEYGFLKIRYKLPDSDTSELIQQPILIASRDVPQNVQRDVQFSTAVAGFGQLLRGSALHGPAELRRHHQPGPGREG